MTEDGKRRMPPVIDVSGSPQEAGYQHGKALAEVVRLNVETCRRHVFDRGVDMQEISARTAFWIKAAEQRAPKFMDELAGIAEGADVSYLELALVSGRHDILDGETESGSGRVIAWRDGRSGSGDVILGRTFGCEAPRVERVVLRRCGGVGEADRLLLSEAGVPGAVAGFNSRGLALAAGTRPDKAVTPFGNAAMPMAARSDLILRQTRFDQAIRRAISPPHRRAAFYVLAQQNGEILGIDAWQDGFRAMSDEDGILTFPPPDTSSVRPASPTDFEQVMRNAGALSASANALRLENAGSRFGLLFGGRSGSSRTCSGGDAGGDAVVMDLSSKEMHVWTEGRGPNDWTSVPLKASDAGVGAG